MSLQRFCNVGPVARDGLQPTMQAGRLAGDDIPIRKVRVTEMETSPMTHDHDTVVVDSGGGSGMGAVLAVIGIIVLLVAVWYFALGPGSSPSTTTNNNSNTVNPPAVSLPPAGSAAP
jgi:hypothetical protein